MGKAVVAAGIVGAMVAVDPTSVFEDMDLVVGAILPAVERRREDSDER